MTAAIQGRKAVTLLNVLTAFSEQPAVPGNACAIAALQVTGAKYTLTAWLQFAAHTQMASF